MSDKGFLILEYEARVIKLVVWGRFTYKCSIFRKPSVKICQEDSDVDIGFAPKCEKWAHTRLIAI